MPGLIPLSPEWLQAVRNYAVVEHDDEKVLLVDTVAQLQEKLKEVQIEQTSQLQGSDTADRQDTSGTGNEIRERPYFDPSRGYS